jgi:hypothetical protein
MRERVCEIGFAHKSQESAFEEGTRNRNKIVGTKRTSVDGGGGSDASVEELEAETVLNSAPTGTTDVPNAEQSHA